MKVVVITGSAHKTGTTAYLADEFIKGAKERGHEVFRFDAAFKNVHPCIACEQCHNTDKGCVFKDDMESLNPELLRADVIVFVSPIYYYDITAQLKAVIDRFYNNDSALHKNKKAVLITAMADDKAISAEGANISYKNAISYLEWENIGIINAKECWTKEDLFKTDNLEKAYKLGKNLA